MKHKCQEFWTIKASRNEEQMKRSFWNVQKLPESKERLNKQHCATDKNKLIIFNDKYFNNVTFNW